MLKDRDGSIAGAGPIAGAERLRAIFDLLPYPIMIHDEAGRIDLLNHEWTRLTGYDLKDTPRLSDWEMLAFGAPELSLAEEGERQIRTRDGSFLTWDFRSADIGGFENGRRAILRTAVDLTARRRAERARRENAEKFSALAEESPLGIVIARGDAIIYCNGTAGTLFGIPPRQSQGMALDEWLGAHTPEATPILGPLLRGESGHGGPFRIGAGEGTWIEAFGKNVGGRLGGT